MRILLILITIFVGGFIAPHPARAASGYCDLASQFPTSFAQDDGTNWILGVSGTTGNSLGVSCNRQWRIVFRPQYKSGGTWHLGVTNTLEDPSYNKAQSYAANQYMTFTTVPEYPVGFTGYWDNGDGLLSPRPVCAYKWRIHEILYSPNNTLVLDEFYSPITAGIC